MTTTAIRICAHCGAIIPEANPFNLTRTELRIYNYIAKHPDRTGREIIDWLYRDDPDGGPTSANLLSAHLHKMAKKLTGVRIITRGGPGATYRLVKDPIA